MQKIAAIGTGILAIVGLLAFAGASERRDFAAARSVTVEDILSLVGEMGLQPDSHVRQDGVHYIVQAVDRRGRQVRVIAEAGSGSILSVAPVQEAEARPLSYYPAIPRIIQVPPVHDAVEQRRVPARQKVDRPRVNRDEPAAPPPRMTGAPPPPPVRQRTILKAPEADDRMLTPIYPTPRFDAKTEAAEKFELPAKVRSLTRTDRCCT